MAKIILKSNFSAPFLVKVFALLALMLISSCSDQGCIEADDFGEYQTQILTVYANAQSGNCDYDSTKDVTDPEHPPILKACFTAGNITDLNDGTTTLSSSNGCAGFTSSPTHLNLCIQQCLQTCLANSRTSLSGYRPAWKPTDPRVGSTNNTVEITPGAEIYITAIGSIFLSDSVTLPDVYVKVDTGRLQYSRVNNWQQSNYYVRSGQMRTVNFSGRWDIGGGSYVGGGSNPTIDNATFNGAKRLVAYLVPHNSSYGDTVPISANTSLWKCTYDNSGNKLESSCFSDNYSAPIANDIALNLYNITSDRKSNTIGSVGGMIRWDNDGLESASYDPITSGTFPCDVHPCSVELLNASKLDPLTEQDIKIYKINPQINTTNVEKTVDVAGSVSFRSLISGSACNGNIVAEILNSNNDVLYTHNIAVNNTGWSTREVSIEPNHKLIIRQFDPARTYSVIGNPAEISCGEAIAIKFLKYQDIQVQKSGYVSFSALSNELGASGACVLNGRIINPNGSHVNETIGSTTITADYYEYNNFNSTTEDGLNSLSVPTGTFSNSVYVRKGQVMRFSPKSWNGNWTVGASKQRQCGIGVAMKIDERPAFLCRGNRTEYVDNPACVQDVVNGSSGPQTIGCKAFSSDCNDSSSSSYCLDAGTVLCTGTVTCTNNGTSPLYQKTGCTSSSGWSEASCEFASITESKCNSCLSKKLQAARQPAKVSYSLPQCYDLENYQGKVANIPASNGFSEEQLSDVSIAKGARILGKFNGSYGNFSSFIDVTEDFGAQPNNNRVYRANDPMIFNQDGVLRFLVLDGSTFTSDSYSNNSPSGSIYNGTNGYKVMMSGMAQYKNGDWLEVKLCEETSATSQDCRALNLGNVVPAAAPKVVEYSNTSFESDPITTTDFSFNSSGILTKVSNSDSNRIVNQPIGSDYYMHRYLYKTDEELEAMSDTQKKDYEAKLQRLRLTFRIKDPEPANCVIPGSGSTNNGVKLTNPNHNAGVSANNGAICGFNEIPMSPLPDSAPSGATSCEKEFYCADVYVNNSGYYDVVVRVKNDKQTVSNIVGNVVTPVIEIMDGKPAGDYNCSSNPLTLFDGVSQANPYYIPGAENDGKVCYESEIKCSSDPCPPSEIQQVCKKEFVCTKAPEHKGQAQIVYEKVINDIRYKSILNICLVVMITFYGVGFLMGVSEFTGSEILGRVLKIGLIYLFVSPTGWEFFNGFIVQIFKQGTDQLAFLMASSFDDSPKLADAIANHEYYDKSILFSSVDRVFNLFFNDTVQKKISGLLFASVFGWIYILIIYYGIWIYICAVANAILLYLTAQVFISVLFILAPIFFIFTLFNQTKSMFDNWLKTLIGFSLQQIFLLTTLAFFNMMMYEVIKMALGYKVCWDEVWVINIITRISLMSFWTLPSLSSAADQSTSVANIGVNNDIPSLFTILFIWIIASLMAQFIDFMTNLAASISGGLKVTGLAADIRKTAAGVTGKFADEMWKKSGKQVAQRVDQALFDSGQKAKQARRQLRSQNQKDLANKSTLRNAGEDAVNRYKVENAAALAGMDKAQQRKTLEDVRNKAISDKGARMGLNASEIERLKNLGFVSNQNTNIISTGLDAVKQHGIAGGIRGKMAKVSDDKVDSRFGSKWKYNPADSDIKKAMKNAKNDEDRKKILDGFRSGALGTKSSFTLTKEDGEWRTRGRQDQELRTRAPGMDEFYNDAQAKLEKEGKISKMAFGTKWTRSEEEKDMIKSAAQEMRDEFAQNRAEERKMDLDVQRANRLEGKYNKSKVSSPTNIDDAKKHLAQQMEREQREQKKQSISAPQDGRRIEGDMDISRPDPQGARDALNAMAEAQKANDARRAANTTTPTSTGVQTNPTAGGDSGGDRD